MNILTYTPPLLLPYFSKGKLEYEYISLCQGRNHKGNNQSKRQQELADKHRKDDLFALLHWRDYQELEKKNKQTKEDFFQPQDEDPTKSKAIIVLDFEKTKLQKLARFHYFIEFLIIASIDLIYLFCSNKDLSNLYALIPLAIPSVITAFYLFMNIIGILRLLAHFTELNLSKYVILRMGEPGTGKSSSGIYDAVIIAERLWQELKFEFWCIKNKISKIYTGTHLEHKVIGLDKDKMPIIEYQRVYTTNRDKIDHTIEIVEAFEYYSENNCIPCLWSNIPIFKEGISCNKFTADHLLQKSKVLYKSIAFVDEIGSMLPPELSNNKIQDIDLNFRFTRHFKDFRIISTEQDGNATLVSARRVTAENKQMIEQKHKLKPLILNYLIELLETKFIEKDPTDRKVNLLTNLKTYVNNVGFRKFKYRDFSNLQVGKKGGEGSKVKSFITPPNLNCNYDNRTFKNLYKCKIQSAEVTQYSNPVLNENEVLDLFNKEIIERSYKTKKTF